ncbi:MAG: phenylalanine--tRNA ligase beta subunit-related protein [Tissierellaceae bacterium]|nr:phenylalanine--tRNA ligase beta subunit-related protein [Tissierellaceae bacterium]
MKFVIEPKVFETLKDVCFTVVVALNIDNTKDLPEIESLLNENIKKCETHFESTKVKESKEVSYYREAFREMDINPNKFMSSIEALLTRISKKKGMPSINPIVNLGNAVSLKYRIPIGAHDLDSSNEDFYVRYSKPGDTFIPFGETEMEPVDNNEIVYATGNSVRTRRWIWRQSELGKITEYTKNVMFPMDGFIGNKEQLLLAQKELADLLKKHFDCDVQVDWIDVENQEFEFEV